MKNGKGKENNKYYDILKFEGEYLYDEKRKGKSYIDEKLEFEGEYLYGKKYDGKGYDKNGNIIYELKNGNGQVNEYNKYEDDDKLEYIGEYKNGIKNGKGKEYYDNDNLIFEGEYKNNLRWNGNIYDPKNNINIYQLKNGKGFIKEFIYDGNIIFGGDFSNGERNRKGKEYYDDGSLRFEGEYLMGKEMEKARNIL